MIRSDKKKPVQLAPNNPRERFDVYRFFNGVSAEGREGIDAGHTRIPLVKTFLLEHVSGTGRRKPKTTEMLWNDLGSETRQIDESFFSITAEVKDPETQKTARKVVGFVESLDERFFAFYTCENSVDAKTRVARWAQHPDLDLTWFSSPLLQTLWHNDISKRGDARFTKLVFKHESIFEMPVDFAEAVSTEESEGTVYSATSESEDDGPEPERRKARVDFADRVERIKSSLGDLQKSYDPMNALAALRIPSLTATGGHDLYQAGQITNRTDSFEDHRNTVRYLYQIYKSVLNYTELLAWQQYEEPRDRSLRIMQTGGAPLVVRFAQPLGKETFERWINLAFQKRNRFKLWGQPIPMGPTKVHVYGADRHLWQPINLELTADGLTALLPRGTCGNTFHRLVANIQHYVSPKIEAWLGDKPFAEVVAKWPTDLAMAGPGSAGSEGTHAH
jgi:hypothetical protein